MPSWAETETETGWVDHCWSLWDRLAGLAIKAPASGAEDLGFESCLRWDFSRSSHANDLKTGTPVATLPGAWHYRVSGGTGQAGVSILWLGEVESLICNFYLSVAARKLVCADPSLRYTIGGKGLGEGMGRVMRVWGEWITVCHFGSCKRSKQWCMFEPVYQPCLTKNHGTVLGNASTIFLTYLQWL